MIEWFAILILLGATMVALRLLEKAWFRFIWDTETMDENPFTMTETEVSEVEVECEIGVTVIITVGEYVERELPPCEGSTAYM